ncbi:hypothetical protein VTK26DRAFT_3879 [Humicola hyalothermophila]
MPKTVLFLGATGGCALSTLRRSLAAGHTCIALCRTPSKLTSLLAPETTTTTTATTATATPGSPASFPNLHIIQGDAHDESALVRCLTAQPTVDTVVFSIGAYPTLKGMSDPHVCEEGMRVLLSALRRCREEEAAAAAAAGPAAPRPRIVAVSTTGISSHARDIPLAMVLPYRFVLATAHRDKKAMEDLLIRSREGEDEHGGWTLIRGSLYTNGPAEGREIRVGVEDPSGGRGEVDL